MIEHHIQIARLTQTPAKLAQGAREWLAMLVGNERPDQPQGGAHAARGDTRVVNRLGLSVVKRRRRSLSQLFDDRVTMFDQSIHRAPASYLTRPPGVES